MAATPGLANLINIMYIVYKRNGNGKDNKEKLYTSLVIKNTITLKITIIINALSNNENNLTPPWLKNLNKGKP